MIHFLLLIFLVSFCVCQNQNDCSLVFQCSGGGDCTGLNICTCHFGYVADDRLGCKKVEDDLFTKPPATPDVSPSTEILPVWVWIIIGVTVCLVLSAIVIICVQRMRTRAVAVQVQRRRAETAFPAGVEPTEVYSVAAGKGYPQNQGDIDYAFGAPPEPVESEEAEQRKLHRMTTMNKYRCKECGNTYNDIALFEAHIELRHTDKNDSGQHDSDLFAEAETMPRDPEDDGQGFAFVE